MRELKFHYAFAKNFICFGPDGIELFFDDYGKLVVVIGKNYDDGGPNDPASNGSGKSSLQDIISYAIYGKTVKKPKQLYHGDVVNVLSGKDLEVEVQFDDYRIKRCRSPNKLQVWQSSDHLWDDTTDITRGTMAETQKVIDDAIGLTHRSFCGVMVFDDSDHHSFLEADTAEKRHIIENLLELDKYREYLEVVKKLKKDANTTVSTLTNEYERLVNEISVCDKRIKTVEDQEGIWKNGINAWLKNAIQKIKQKQSELEATDVEKSLIHYQQSQAEMLEIQDKITEFVHKQSRLSAIIKEANDKLDLSQKSRRQINEIMQQHALNVQNSQNQYKISQKTISSLKNLEEGTECTVCKGIISKNNFVHVLSHEENIIKNCESAITKESNFIELEKSKFGEKSAAISKLEGHIFEANQSLNSLELKLVEFRKKISELDKIKKPDTNSIQQVLETEIVELKRQCKEKKSELDGNSPYKEILDAAIQEKNDKNDQVQQKNLEIKNAEIVLPYYEFWAEAFGDKGIRRFVVNGIISALNARIAYWLHHLIDNRIELIFNDKLEETITRNGTSAVYHSMSDGEKRRINLAVSQAFSYVMTIHSGCCPSLVFLDEVTGGGIDKVGVSGVYNMIFELAKERQVFVTTHNETLSEMLEGCENIVIKKQNDISVLI